MSEGVRYKRGVRSAIGLLLVALFAAAALLGGNRAAHYYRAFKVAKAHPVYDRVFAEANRDLDAAAERVVFFGDSRIARWDPRPRGGSVQLVFRGVGGETTEQMRFRFAQDVLALEPDWVVLQAGINDLVAASLQKAGGAATVERCAENLRGFVRTATAQGTRVILISIIPRSHRDILRRWMWPNTLDRYVQQVNASLKPLSEHADVRWIDARALLQDGEGRWLPNVDADALHLTREGYGRLNRAVEQELESERDAVQ